MSQLHKALETLRPRDSGDVPLENLNGYLRDIFTKAELIANSVPPPPNGSPFESVQRTRSEPSGATSLADLTISQVRRPPVDPEHAELQKGWGKPVKLSKQDASLGISVFKMAGNDRHGAWFARTSVHEGLGFAKWKRAMVHEFPESLAVQGGPGEGNVRGIGSDRRLEDTNVPGVGKLEVYQLSAQFPGPTAPREFLTLLLTSENALTDVSKVGEKIPRHYMVVSIPTTHPDAPPRDGLVRGQYESIEMIREIPLSSDDDDSETNPVEWIMITRSDPGGGIPRFMVERNTPSSIVQDAGKFLQWACSRDDIPLIEGNDGDGNLEEGRRRASVDSQRRFSIAEANGILAGVGASIVDDPRPASFRRPSQRTIDKDDGDIIHTLVEKMESYVPEALNPLHRSASRASSSALSSTDSFASAEEVNPESERLQGGLPVDDGEPTPSTISEKSVPLSMVGLDQPGQNNEANRELEKIEKKRQQAAEKLPQAREKQTKEEKEASEKTAKELERTIEKHDRERKKQEEKYNKEMQKLEERRERETKKLLAKQQKEADKNNLLKTQRERDEWKQKAELAEEENKLLQDQIRELQRENTAFVAAMGKTPEGIEILKTAREELQGKGRKRASSRASGRSTASKSSAGNKSEHERQRSSSHLAPS